MSKAEKLVSYENYVSGIEASYQLGVMDGQAETQPAELRDLRRQLANMLISYNKASKAFYVFSSFHYSLYQF